MLRPSLSERRHGQGCLAIMARCYERDFAIRIVLRVGGRWNHALATQSSPPQQPPYVFTPAKMPIMINVSAPA
jgi:hypothetical protein